MAVFKQQKKVIHEHVKRNRLTVKHSQYLFTAKSLSYVRAGVRVHSTRVMRRWVNAFHEAKHVTAK